ncbi:Predicted permease superfamily [Methylophaga thiooxydans DMS010]|uniref:Predicted permease superfamily n=2 Tax=Methylophaga thiooxydans TaxID=392484 RepID=C0N6K9_9GAMM|nr:Predicted permease superfamily [Methylophaga thiooxydans DMS010]
MSQQFNDTLSMFAFLAIELSVLFIGISVLVGALQRHIPASKVEALLHSRRRSSYFLAAGLGAITPFCSCSTIPMLKGLIRARAGFGPMMVFLLASPLLNPIIVALLIATFGFKLTAIYVFSALIVSLVAGWLFHALGLERFVRQNETHSRCGSSVSDQNTGSSCSVVKPAQPEPERCCDTPADRIVNTTTQTTSEGCCGSSADKTVADSIQDPMQAEPQGCSDNTHSVQAKPAASSTVREKYRGLWREAWSDFKNVLPYLLIGVSIGSIIYGYVPIGLLQQYAGGNNPFAIPVAAVIGIPLYIRAEAVIPLAGVLMSKGVGAGVVLALIIGSAGASLTELILLRSLFKTPLLLAFVSVIISMAIIAGFVAFVFL